MSFKLYNKYFPSYIKLGSLLLLFSSWAMYDSCDSMDCSLPGSSVHRISQVRILERVAISFSRGSCWPGNWTCVSCTDRRILYPWTTREAPPLVDHKLNGGKEWPVFAHHCDPWHLVQGQAHRRCQMNIWLSTAGLFWAWGYSSKSTQWPGKAWNVFRRVS